jgi:tRNA pseudouridine38-40 synthase
MPRYVVDVKFKGTAYAGWQVQENLPHVQTVQGEVDSALSKCLRTPIVTYGAGRTDTGVHALQLPAHFDFEGEIPEHFMLSVNAILPRDIAITKIYKAVQDNFHTRFHATGRAYRYHLIFQKDPIQLGLSRWVKEKVDVEAMMAAAKVFLEYDSFESFCKTNSNNKTFFCKLTASSFEWEGDTLVYHIKADRFLRGMVRTIMGTLMLVGRGKLDEAGVRRIIESKNRQLAGPTELADGLFLSEVVFPEGCLEEIWF